MATTSKSAKSATVTAGRQLQILVVQSNPADTVLTVEAFKVAGLTSGLQCVTDGKDALQYVRQEGRHPRLNLPGLVATPDFRVESLEDTQIDPVIDAHPDCGCSGF